MVDKQRKLPELLAPAGDMERLKMAVLYGADAVYLAGTDFGMRAFAGNFDPDELKAAVAYAHAHNVRVHCTINTMPRGDEIVRLPAHLERLNDAGVDAVIVADLGAFTLAGKYAPNCQRHISTQASISNYVTANAWYDLGASRVILARELSLEEIRTIRENTPAELEIEAFVHGAMCVSYSGRCLLSNYMTGRDASRGACAQPCRYHYALMEEKRPGEYFPIEEDEKGSYILNSRDMCMIDHLDDLIDAGLSSLKIEGRPNPPTMPPSSPALTGTVWTTPLRAALSTLCGGTRWSMSATGPTPPASITAIPASTTKIPATSGNGRWWRWSRNVTPTATPSFPCGTSSAPVTRWSW